EPRTRSTEQRSEGDSSQPRAGARLHPELLEKIVTPRALSRAREITTRPPGSAGHLEHRAAGARRGGPIDFGVRLRQRRAGRSSGSRGPGGDEVAGIDE